MQLQLYKNKPMCVYIDGQTQQTNKHKYIFPTKHHCCAKKIFKKKRGEKERWICFAELTSKILNKAIPSPLPLSLSHSPPKNTTYELKRSHHRPTRIFKLEIHLKRNIVVCVVKKLVHIF